MFVASKLSTRGSSGPGKAEMLFLPPAWEELSPADQMLSLTFKGTVDTNWKGVVSASLVSLKSSAVDPLLQKFLVTSARGRLILSSLPDIMLFHQM